MKRRETVNLSVTTLYFVRVITISVRQDPCIFCAIPYIVYGLSGFYFIS